MHLSRDFFDCLGKALEGVASLRREGFDNDSRKKTRQRCGETYSVIPFYKTRKKEERIEQEEKTKI